MELDGRLLCSLHYHSVQGTLCGGCGVPITGRCVSALGRKFHPEHFVCALCLRQLNQGIVKEQRGKPYCLVCFEKLFVSQKWGAQAEAALSGNEMRKIRSFSFCVCVFTVEQVSDKSFFLFLCFSLCSLCGTTHVLWVLQIRRQIRCDTKCDANCETVAQKAGRKMLTLKHK